MLRELAREFERRADLHDMSKLQLDELEGFIQLDSRRQHQKEEYGSKSYEAGISDIGAVKLHVSRNRHHPEYWASRGIEGMSFVDIIEMLCDWEIARQMRDTEQDINKTWEMRQKRFDLSFDELTFLRGIWESIDWQIQTVT